MSSHPLGSEGVDIIVVRNRKQNHESAGLKIMSISTTYDN